MRLSIIVAAYGVEPYLARCLDSLLDQDLDPAEYEVIVIDDGSPDRGHEIAERHAASHPNIRVIRQQNRGVGATRNRGLELAVGEAVWFVDGDDRIVPGRLGAIVRAMERHRLAVLALEHRPVAAKETVVVESLPPEPAAGLPVVTGRQYIADVSYTSETTMYVFDRRFLLDHGLRFTEGYFTEDVVLTAAALVAAHRVAHLPGLVYLYVQRAGSMMHRHDAEHTRRFAAWFTSMAVNLDAVRAGVAASDDAPPGCVERLENRVETLGFFLIARWVRSDLPLDELPAILDEFRAIGAYPMHLFPLGERPVIPYRVLRYVFDRPALLRPFTAAIRTALAGRRALSRVLR